MSNATSERNADVLIVGSHAPELAGLRAYISEKLIGEIRGILVHAKVVGMGMPAAGASTARGILALRPRAVILVGSAGLYPGQHINRNAVIVGSRFSLLDRSVLSRRASFPVPMQTTMEGHPMLNAGLSAARTGTVAAGVATPLASTLDETFAGSIYGATHCSVENLEAFAIAHACRAAEIPFAAALGVSHSIGPSAAKHWQLGQRDAVTAAAHVVVAWLQQGAQGLPHGGL